MLQSKKWMLKTKNKGHSMISQSDQAVQDIKSQVELIKKQHDLRMHDLEMMLKQQEIQNSKEEKSEAA